MMLVLAQVANPTAQAPVQSFQVQFQQFMYYAGPIVQLVFWIGILVVALLAYLELRRIVSAGVAALEGSEEQEPPAAGRPAAEKPKAAPRARKPKDEDVSVDEFVE